MSKRKVYNYAKRSLAFLMAMIMTLSVVQSSTITAFAQTGSDIVVTEIETVDVIGETETSVSNTEEASETVSEAVEEESVSEAVSTEVSSETEEEDFAAVEETTEVIETTEAETVIEVVETVEEVETVAAVDVMEGESYTGTVTSDTADRAILSISETAFASYGETFSDEAIINILNTRADAGETYDIVAIEYDSLIDGMSGAVWNAAVGIIASESEFGSAIYANFNGGSAPDENWTFTNPTVTEAETVNMVADVSVGDDGRIYVNFSNVTFDCSKTDFDLYLNDADAQAEWFETYRSALGETSMDIEVRDSEDNATDDGGYYGYNDGNSCQLSIWGINELSVDSSYAFFLPYSGKEYTEEIDGQECSVLEINAWDMAANADFEANARSILSDTENTYDMIRLCYRSITDKVGNGVWNLACGKLNSGSEHKQICINFAGDTNPDENWCFENPKELSADLILGSSFSISEDGVASITFDEGAMLTTNIAEGINASFSANLLDKNDAFTAIKNVFGTESKDLELSDAEGNVINNAGGYYNYQADGSNTYMDVNINGITNLSVNTTYIISEREYRGDYNEWYDEQGFPRKSLYIHPGNVGQTEFTAEQITSILSNYDENSFDEINIVYCTETMGGTVDDALINATLPYLVGTVLDVKSNLRITFQHPQTGDEVAWVLPEAGTQTEDQTLSADFSVTDGVASISLGSQSLVADSVNVTVNRSIEQNPDGVAELKTIFGDSATRLSVGDTDAPAGFDMDDWSVWVWIDDVNQLTPDTVYTIGEFTYKGRVDTWDDGRKELFIHYGDAGKEGAFTEQELLDILANYENYKEYNEEDNLYSIYIEQPTGESDMIYKSVADAAASLLPNGGEVKFAFRNSAIDISTEFIFEGIKAGVVQAADQSVKATLSPSSDDQLVFNRNAFELTAGDEGSVSVGYTILHTSKNYDLRQAIVNAFDDSEDYYLIETIGGEVGGEVRYNRNESNIWVYLHDITVLESGVDYPLDNYFYRGKVEEQYDEDGNVIGNSLYIDADGCNKLTFDEETFQKIVDYWKNKGKTFEYISVEQQYFNSNIIDKDIYNAARSLLSDPANQEMTFTFCSCLTELCDDEGNVTRPYAQDDMNWHFIGCTDEATKDIDATVSVIKMGIAGGLGVSIELKDNTYPAEHTNVQFWMDDGAVTLEQLLKPAFGKAKEESSLVVLEKGTTLKMLADGSAPAYYNNGGEDGKSNLFLVKVEEWTPGIDNRLIEAYTRREAPIGEEIRLPLFSYDPNDPEDPGYPPEDENEEWNHPDLPKSDIKFKLLTPEYATLENYDRLTPISPWKTVYTLCTYKSVSNEACMEVLAYPTCVEITGMLFKEKEVEVEWNGNLEEEAPRGFLDINVYPLSANNHINPQDFTWTVSGNSIQLIEHDYYMWNDETQIDELIGTRPDGEFVVTGYGETTVTVQYKDFAPITCTVNVIEPVQVPLINSIFAIPAIDTKLSDLGNLDELVRARCDEEYKNYTGTFTWKDDSISLAPYANMEWAEFGAIYTEADGREVPLTIPVEMLRVTEIGLYAAYITEYLDDENYDTPQLVKNLALNELNNSTVLKGEELIMGYQVGINREQFDEDGMTDEFAAFERYIDEGKLEFQWSSKETLNEVPSDTEDGAFYHNGTIKKPRSYTADKKGKKTFTVSAVNLLTNKVIFKNSATVIVNEKPLFSFGDDVFDLADTIDLENEMKGTYTITVSGNNCDFAKKLTIKSADTSVLKLGKIKVADPVDGKVVITVPYEFKKLGKTVLKVTAADEVKSSKSFTVERVDYAPKIPNTNYTIDKSWMHINEETTVCESVDVIDIAFQHDTTPAGMVEIVEPENKEVFKLDGSVEGAQYWIQLADLSLKNKTYNVTLKIPYTINGDESGEVRYSEQVIKVKVTQSKIKVTAKQTKKINEFYKLTSEEINGIITVKTPYYLSDYSLNADSVFDLRMEHTNGFNEFTFGLVLKEGQNIEKLTDAQKKITLNYKLQDIAGEHNGSVNLTLKTENKKPSLVLPKKNDTLYPNMGIDGSGFVVMDKATGELLDLDGNVSLVTNKKKNETQVITSESYPTSAPYEYLTVGKNNYYIYSDYYGINYWLYDDTNAVKSTDKFIIRVQKENWNGYVDVTYSAKVDLKVPKLKLDSKTLTINANDDVYSYQTVGTYINLTGNSGIQFDEIWISGKNKAASDALKNNLSFTWNREESKIQLSITDKGTLDEEAGMDTRLKPGAYKFKVWATFNGTTLNTDLTLKVVDKAQAKSVKVTKKGSIDVLRRGTTQITMNPKLSNLSGEIVNFRLEGPDADLFNYYYDGENCVVQAKEGTNYSTKTNYNVTPVYGLDANNGYYEVDGKTQKIKVTQSKPKVLVWASSNTLYGDKSEGVYLGFDALLKDDNIGISRVQLLNYTNDLDWNDEAGLLKLNDNTPKDITKASGKYTLKFAVTYIDAAGNEKAQQVSYKLNIVR